MGKRRGIPDGDAEDLNKLFQMGFVSIEEVDGTTTDKTDKTDKKQEPVAKKSKKSEWSVCKMVKSMAPPCPEITNPKKWGKYSGIKKVLLAGIIDKGYEGPTEIQEAVLGDMGVKELVGSAPTGSGKTLAFSLPFLNTLADAPLETSLTALVLCPTRELALQVSGQIKLVGKYIPALRLATIVGGMSEDKQTRQLSLNPTVIVATAGRLAEMTEFDSQLQSNLQAVKYLVIDEADRMVLDKQGRFPDLDKILQFTKSENTFLFSATLSSEKLKKAFSTLRRKLNMKKPTQIHIEGKLDLIEQKAQAMDQNDKDKWIYMFLKENFSKKAIVFVNSIEAVRRLHLILKLFFENSGKHISPLHAQMQQRQRLKHLDRFKQSSNGVLVCSDVAARGLDIPLVDLVIQAEAPKSLDIHKHRIGRTARAGSHGTAVVVICPKEAFAIKQKEELKFILKLPDGSVHSKHGDRIETAIKIANEIEHLVYSTRKTDKEKRVTSKAQQELGFEDNDQDEEENLSNKLGSKQLAALKSQLLHLLNN